MARTQLILYNLIAVVVFNFIPRLNVSAQTGPSMVRLAIIEVDKSELDEYKRYLKEEVNASIQKEPGVHTLYAVNEKETPARVTLFETYADSSAYKSHLATVHFQKYKQGTLDMVTSLKLIEAQPILYHRNKNLDKAKQHELYIRLISIEINPVAIADYTSLANDVMLPGLQKEPGVLVIYAVAEKERPTEIHILEVYKNRLAYDDHIKTKHFLKYKETSATMVKSLRLLDAQAIVLGAKREALR